MDLSDEGDVKELKEVMSIMATEIPKLLEAISKTMYSADNAAKLGEQTAEFYKKLKDAGMTEEQAFKLTEEFMANFSVGSMIGKIIGGARRGDSTDDIEKEVNDRIKKKIKKAMGDEDED
jgi:F0F1-type ATP synthase assembly protein I